MRFCTSCGKEVSPGKKFCEYCGTPVEQPSAAPLGPPDPAPPSRPATPPAEPVNPAGGSGKTRLVAGIVVLLAVFAVIWFIGIPALSKSPGTAQAVAGATTIQPPVTDVYTTISRYTAVVPDTSVSSETTRAYEEKYVETYNQVYFASRPFTGGQKEVFSQDVPSPRSMSSSISRRRCLLAKSMLISAFRPNM